MTTRIAEDTFPGTLPELLAYQALLDLGKVPDVDFTFQTSLLGGRLDRGGLVIDFILPPDLAMSVLGEYFHYVLGGGTQARDLMTREIVQVEYGFTLIFLDEEDLGDDARYYVSEALAFRDHSKMAGGLL